MRPLSPTSLAVALLSAATLLAGCCADDSAGVGTSEAATSPDAAPGDGLDAGANAEAEPQEPAAVPRRKERRRRRTASTDSPKAEDALAGPVCARMCDLAPIDPFTGTCVARFLSKKGYKVKRSQRKACDPEVVNTPDGCRTCAGLVGVKDDHCQAAHDACF